eukprot:2930445-Rhodomonas_salina.2
MDSATRVPVARSDALGADAGSGGGVALHGEPSALRAGHHQQVHRDGQEAQGRSARPSPVLTSQSLGVAM